ncbi:MAG: hypothetical protein ACYDBV_14500 [Nitrospiria bacterium]
MSSVITNLQEKVSLLRQMRLIRRFEEKAAEMSALFIRGLWWVK